MAASPTPRPTPADATGGAAGSADAPSGAAANPAWAPLLALRPPLPLAVAYSGGADSTCLLHAAAAAWPGQLHAIHVHHGLQAAADGFERHAQQVCAQLAVPLSVVRLDARHRPGQSPEEAARAARYAALAQAAQAVPVQAVLLAQHADDQVETVMLALSRGAGLPGLAAMPACFERQGVRFLRPLLAVHGAALRQWCAQAGAAFVEDPSNADTAFTRNRIRHAVLPGLAQAFPQYRETFSRSARHAAQAQAVLDEVAAADLAALGGEPAIAGLRALSRPRQANLLRHWLRSVHGCAASASQLDELLDQVGACSTRGHRIHIKVGAGFVTREGTKLLCRHSV